MDGGHELVCFRPDYVSQRSGRSGLMLLIALCSYIPKVGRSLQRNSVRTLVETFKAPKVCGGCACVYRVSTQDHPEVSKGLNGSLVTSGLIL